MVSNSKEFILDFFKGSKITDEKGVLTISEVPEEFEDFIGKKAPYKLVFDFKLHNKVRDSELIMQGSYFLLSIRDYLSNKGQTSLLKINIKPDLSSLNQNSKLKNCRTLGNSSNFRRSKKQRLFSVQEVKPANFDFLSEFSFLSIYQYLNEKKQSISRILVRGKKVLDMDISKFKTQNGHKEEIPAIDLNEAYEIAKNRLDSQVIKEARPIKAHLREKLDKELLRVKDHYFKQIKEKDEEVERCIEKIKLLKSKLRHTYYDRDISILNRVIRESSERLENLKKKSYKERLKVEEKFHTTDEIEKHVLSIKNSLINVTLFYYPVYNLLVSSKGKTRYVRYDPVLSEIKDF